MQITFYKYQGTGNDFIMIDDRTLSFPIDDVELIKKWCDRRFGIGADGLILLQPHSTAAYYMKYYNSDGRESSMCGNGGRCLAAFALTIGVVNGPHEFMAVDGLHQATPLIIEGKPLQIKLKMKDVDEVKKLDSTNFELNTGSPHYVEFIAEDVHTIPLLEMAKTIRYNKTYKKEGINVNMVNAITPQHLIMRTYERGVEDETFSCGTGVTAAALSSIIHAKLQPGEHHIQIKTPGGELEVSAVLQTTSDNFSDIWLTGPATFVFKGNVEI